MPGAKYPSSLLSRMRIYRIILPIGSGTDTLGLPMPHAAVRGKALGGTLSDSTRSGARPKSLGPRGVSKESETPAVPADRRRKELFEDASVLTERQKLSDLAHPALNLPLRSTLLQGYRWSAVLRSN